MTPRSYDRFTLTACVPLAKADLLRYRARRFYKVSKRLKALSALYRRKDMLGALLFMAVVHANACEIAVADKEVTSIALERDDDTGTSRIVVRAKRGRKAAA